MARVAPSGRAGPTGASQEEVTREKLVAASACRGDAREVMSAPASSFCPVKAGAQQHAVNPSA